ncbi:MAG TPA: hypothetical protein VFF73_21750 [Planctomycetota bacterium]|nr:hypothetical protein [Planctomycetota bacterium]
MVKELVEARERAQAAWSLVQADLARLKEAARAEVMLVSDMRPAALVRRHPLAFLGALAGLGFVAGVRGGRRRAAYRAIAKAGSEVVQTAIGAPRQEKSLRRKLGETLLLGIAAKGSELVARMVQDHVESALRPKPEELVEQQERISEPSNL